MESLPLTRSAQFTDFPAGEMKVLFPELPSPGLRQVEVTAVISGECSPAMTVVTAERNVRDAFAMAWGACQGVEGFEIRVRMLA